MTEPQTSALGPNRKSTAAGTAETTHRTRKMMEEDDEKGVVNRAVAAADRSLVILEAFLDRPRPRSLVELEQRTGLFKSVILRYMLSFEARGFVQKDDDGLYRLGPRAFQLGKAFEVTFDIARVMQPVVDELTRATNESASVYIRDGDFRLCLLRSDPDRAVRVATRAGSRMPIDGTATSMIMTRYSGTSYGDIAPISKDDIACTQGIGDPLLASMSTPLFGPGDSFIGTLTLAGVNGHFDVTSERFKSLLFDTAMTASRQLGATFAQDDSQ